jgi:demethylmenaquinone methyltransferase/2-methoxy-6-polyprenyl-1,4-benzoquinol methylase
MMRTQVMPRPEHSLGQAFASGGAKARYVRRLFATIAGRYDLITRLLSFGLDQRWKRRLLDMAPVTPGARVLDLACGTGDLALLALHRGARVVGLDITAGMLDLARRKTDGADVAWIVGDMCALPVAGGTIDVITTGYGLRNVPDLARAIDEIHRALGERGVLCSLDFNRPDSFPVRAVYLTYLTIVGSTLGFVLHGDPDTYRYIPESIRRYPGALRVREMLRAAGFRNVRYQPVLGGLMAIHVASK